MNTNALVVLCTCPTTEAESLSQKIIEAKLAACVNILPTITSIFSWEATIQKEQESLLLIKTTQAIYPKLEAHLAEMHSYDVPEIIALPIHKGLPNYLNWINDTVNLDIE